MAFSELLAQSCFSFLRGASQPAEVVEQAKSLGLRSLALCDLDGLYGSVRALASAKALSFPLHVGVELSLARLNAEVVRVGTPRQAGAPRADKVQGASLVLLVQNRQGYTNLCRLLTLSQAGLPKGVSLLEGHFLRQNHEGLLVVLPVQLGASGAIMQEWLPLLAEVFNGQGVVACFRRLDGQDTARICCAEKWSRLTGFDVVASARPNLHTAERRPLADIMYCIRHGIMLDAAGTGVAGNRQAFIHSERQMRRLFSERLSWIDNTQRVIERLAFCLDEVRYQFPCELKDGESADEKLERLTWTGAESRYSAGVPPRVAKQLQKELALISRLELSPYFLCTWEIVEIARSLRILCQGRGSAANSAVCYVLGITAVDPARSSLLFERFLSEERAEPPDIDIDFEHERREEVIQEIYRRYGRQQAAMVSEVICYRGKSALREVGKVFGLSISQVEHLSKTITHWDSAEVSEQRLAECGLDARDTRVQQVIYWARQLEGFPRHMSVHVGGFVLSKTPICEVAPVEPAAMKDRTVLQWDKDDIETLGFYKVDVLGLGMLTAIRKALELIWNDGGLREGALGAQGNDETAFDPLDVVTRVPAEAGAVYALVSEADTVGVFQIESRAQMAMLPRLRPQCFYDLVVEVALVRPGPIQGGMVHPYLRRRNGEERKTVPHPDLWPVLERTLGVPLFQEQVMQLAIIGAGYTAGQADQLRRDMAAWKKTGRLMRHKQRLLDGFSRKGIPLKFGEALFEQIKGFGEYGFPESHAASFALLVYLSAWQKACYPAHFVCALINSQPMGFYSVSSLIKDAKVHGVEVRPLNVMWSDWDCSLERATQRKTEAQTVGAGSARALRLGLRLLKGFSRKSAERLMVARRGRHFESMADFVSRCELQKNEVEALAEAGALEELVAGRRQALWAASAPQSGALFDGVSLQEVSPSLLRVSDGEQLALDYERVGFSLTDHPLSHLRRQLMRDGAIRAQQLPHIPNQSRVKLAGLVLSRQRPGTANGVVFVTLEDESGTINIVVFARVFERYRTAARHACLLWVEGKIERALTQPRPGGKGRATPVIHVIASYLESLDSTDQRLRVPSRDFH